jgi:hypothetical protein
MKGEECTLLPTPQCAYTAVADQDEDVSEMAGEVRIRVRHSKEETKDDCVLLRDHRELTMKMQLIRHTSVPT